MSGSVGGHKIVIAEDDTQKIVSSELQIAKLEPDHPDLDQERA